MGDGCWLDHKGVHQGIADRGLEKVTVPEASVHFRFCTTQQKITLSPGKWRNIQIEFFFFNLRG